MGVYTNRIQAPTKTLTSDWIPEDGELFRDEAGNLYMGDNVTASDALDPINGGGGDGGGAGIADVVSVSGSDTITTANDGDMINVTTGATNATITLPSAASATGVTFVIRKADSDVGSVSTSPETTTLRCLGDTMEIVSNGNDWIVSLGNVSADQRTGATIAFDEPAIYNTPESPSNATVTYDTSGAVSGTEVVAYFNHASEPTWPSGSYRVGVWNNGELNAVRFLYINSSNVLVEVNSNNVTANTGHFQTIRKTATTTRNSTTTLAADPDLVVPMLANKTYVIKGTVWGNTAAAADFKYRVQGPASPTTFHGRVTNTGGGTSAPTNGLVSAYHSSDQVFLGSSAFFFAVEFEFRISNGANAGNWEFHWAQNTSDAGNTNVQIGSWLDYMQVN